MSVPGGESLESFINFLNRKIEKKTEKGGSRKRKRKSVRRKPQGGAKRGNCAPDIPLSPNQLNALGAALGKFKTGKAKYNITKGCPSSLGEDKEFQNFIDELNSGKNTSINTTDLMFALQFLSLQDGCLGQLGGAGESGPQCHASDTLSQEIQDSSQLVGSTALVTQDLAVVKEGLDSSNQGFRALQEASRDPNVTSGSLTLKVFSEYLNNLRVLSRIAEVSQKMDMGVMKEYEERHVEAGREAAVQVSKLLARAVTDTLFRTWKMTMWLSGSKVGLVILSVILSRAWINPFGNAIIRFIFGFIFKIATGKEFGTVYAEFVEYSQVKLKEVALAFTASTAFTNVIERLGQSVASQVGPTIEKAIADAGTEAAAGVAERLGPMLTEAATQQVASASIAGTLQNILTPLAQAAAVPLLQGYLGPAAQLALTQGGTRRYRRRRRKKTRKGKRRIRK